jgi:hypothetical protein
LDEKKHYPKKMVKYNSPTVSKLTDMGGWGKRTRRWKKVHKVTYAGNIKHEMP